MTIATQVSLGVFRPPPKKKTQHLWGCWQEAASSKKLTQHPRAAFLKQTGFAEKHAKILAKKMAPIILDADSLCLKIDMDNQNVFRRKGITNCLFRMM